MTMSAWPVRGEHVHHIVPKYAGGTNDPNNLVRLTIEDHAIAHMVRYKIYGDYRDKLAWMGLSGQNTDRAYLRNEAFRHFLKTDNPMWRPECKKKISESMKKNNPNKGYNNRTARAIEVEYEDGTVEKYSYGKKFSEQKGVPYVTVKNLWKTGKGSRKHKIKEIRQL